ncbi:MAG: cysteine desulfurase [Parcubacteria group bacterium Gr01-1014_48]|nr:MAG: cysteine desulfurase [Parcubacteria group bacterium Greene0416_14]TSC73355.1 MAG: cysteine desulfurase [Parcubacteria group bacterium Gr01-1014_48]TSD01320.1 MAG: cysteine desulfurase [Parcubacteria group bacterium Greene1014_15]TSD08007.1 MAG: cysteine desulfurase [Parcubacteria group bacterium Greene0714_4]
MHTKSTSHTKRIYFDAAATTPVDGRVFAAMEPLFCNAFGNPGSIHVEGVAAKEMMSRARKTCADVLHAHADEIVFTSGGTESNNMAIMGVTMQALKDHEGDYSKIHVVTSSIEHASVLEVCKELEGRGVRVTYVPVDEDGRIMMDAVKRAVTRETTLVSVMLANNEIGTAQSIADIAKHIRKVRKGNKEAHAYPYFHTDAAQAAMWCDVYVEKLGVDLVSVDGHKIYGPKGVGLLYMRRGTKLFPLLFGGGQEGDMRAGTESVPLVVGLAKALELAESERIQNVSHITGLRTYFLSRLRAELPEAELNGDSAGGMVNIVNISLLDMDSDFLVISLDERGIACASKSACHSNDDSSYVVAAIGKGREAAASSLRFSMLKDAKKKDVDRVVAALVEIVEQNRR